MARIAGVILPSNKRIEAGLTYIYGIGFSAAQKILQESKINPDIRVKDLSGDDIVTLQRFITNEYVVGGDLKRDITMNIKRLQEIGSYRGTRHKRSLPARGQRTKTNARTRKGPRKSSSIIAKKKSPTKK